MVLVGMMGMERWRRDWGGDGMRQLQVLMLELVELCLIVLRAGLGVGLGIPCDEDRVEDVRLEGRCSFSSFSLCLCALLLTSFSHVYIGCRQHCFPNPRDITDDAMVNEKYGNYLFDL